MGNFCELRVIFTSLNDWKELKEYCSTTHRNQITFKSVLLAPSSTRSLEASQKPRYPDLDIPEFEILGSSEYYISRVLPRELHLSV